MHFLPLFSGPAEATLWVKEPTPRPSHSSIMKCFQPWKQTHSLSWGRKNYKSWEVYDSQCEGKVSFPASKVIPLKFRGCKLATLGQWDHLTRLAQTFKNKNFLLLLTKSGVMAATRLYSCIATKGWEWVPATPFPVCHRPLYFPTSHI